MCWLKKALKCEFRSQSSGSNDSCSKSSGGCNNICGCKNNCSSYLICIIITEKGAMVVTVKVAETVVVQVVVKFAGKLRVFIY